MDEKASLRARILARRDTIDPADRAAKSAAICDELQLIAQAASAQADSAMFEQSGDGMRPFRIAVYAPMRSEVDILPFATAAYKNGWDVCFPCMVRDAFTPKSEAPACQMPAPDTDGDPVATGSPAPPAHMAFYLVPHCDFQKARHAFLDTPLRCFSCAALEQAGFRQIDPATLDLVTVPLVAFDAHGQRLGYGGGNYDRFLPLLRADALAVGVGFKEQRVPCVPVEPHDQPLARIVSA